MKSNLKRFRVGRWRFAYAFRSYQWGIHRQSKGAGSVAFGFGMFTYLRQGKWEPLPKNAWFAR